MARGKRWSAADRARAVGIATVTTSENASEQTGIPRRTIDDWRTAPEFAVLAAKTREDVADLFWAAVQIGVDQVAQGLLGDEPLRDKATAVGILYDKHALLTGGATSRSESRAITDDLNDDEKQRLREWIDGLASGAPVEGAAG